MEFCCFFQVKLNYSMLLFIAAMRKKNPAVDHQDVALEEKLSKTYSICKVWWENRILLFTVRNQDVHLEVPGGDLDDLDIHETSLYRLVVKN